MPMSYSLSPEAASRRSRPRYSVRPFYMTILAISVLTLISAGLHLTRNANPSRSGPQLAKRQHSLSLSSAHDLFSLQDNGSECRQVHNAKDQCAFVLAHCADHEIGLFSYLQLYFCRLKNAKPVAFSIIALWLAVLFSTIGIAASDFLCINLSTIAGILGMSESLTGVTFLAFGNGSPDVFSTFAAMSSDSGSLAIGELIGAAGFITAVVAGSMALVRPFKVARRSFVRDVGFFICAASFSLVFLADGELHVWECITMIAFYIFYVVVVVTWHWYMGRQRRIWERNTAARTHFHIPENQELEIEEEPEDDDQPVAGQDQPLLHGPSIEDFSALERANIPAWKIDADVDEDDEVRDRYLAELQGNMRVSRAPTGARRSTINPIRPSLVGALEFRSVLSSLQRSRNIRSGPIHLRRYSDEAGLSATPDQPNRLIPRLHPNSSRARAVSANEPTTRYSDEAPIGPQDDLVVPGPATVSQPLEHHEPEGGPRLPFIVPSTELTTSPSSSGFPSRSQSPVPRDNYGGQRHLAPPEDDFQNPNYLSEGRHSDRGASIAISPRGGPRGDVPPLSPRPGSESNIPFPPYSDEIMSIRSLSPTRRLSPPSLSNVSTYTQDQYIHVPESKPLKWWPYKVLPAPHIIIASLFPTLYGWNDKTGWERFLGIVSAPSVFLLTMTLPVVEPKDSRSDNSSEPTLGAVTPAQTLGHQSPDIILSGTSPVLHAPQRITISQADGPNNVPVFGKPLPSVGLRHRQDSELPIPQAAIDQSTAPKEWNRWLLSVQLVTSPFFVTLTTWVNLDDDLNPRTLLIPSLISLLVSCVLLITLLLTTKSGSTQLPDRSRPFLAFLGFIVAIAWISTIASEVVNVLKTIGVVLSISDSLLGLTVFAIGNSLGDLVADITVARLGYPVMALSACFGGPMLNILLGVGIGGLYMTLHPSSSSSYALVPQAVSTASRIYHITISKTLLISGAGLLLTLVGLLIAVPLNGWRMDRKVGWALITVWSISTLGNVILELASGSGS
ncbi:hypothetical protein AJ80_08477 [Polytolypa hystricis UAMH7299]|uniref:Sodium/calcium exchanger membrane region domain-containing protein n=1 Tax=Polytolypa hystricis (strain UAMH7299) TaxID=1447883 RepID=A0A2B7X7Q3_POLH7|nr:hypothetical protein AJ80_08477 [Polytolypa hystricis UAMH7299]